MTACTYDPFTDQIATITGHVCSEWNYNQKGQLLKVGPSETGKTAVSPVD